MMAKALKHDFLFSKDMYLMVAGSLVGAAVIMRLTGLSVIPFGGAVGTLREATLFFILTIAGIASIFQVIIHFNRNLFDETGYMMLTLPVKRFTLLMSKLVISVVWFNFMILAAASVVIIASPQQLDFVFMGLSRSISFANLVALIKVNITAVSFIVILFFSATLTHCRLWRRRSNGLGVVVGAACVGLFFLVSNMVFMRHRKYYTLITEYEPMRSYNAMGEYLGTYYTEFTRTIFYRDPGIGINAVVIPLGGDGTSFDIYGYGVMIVFSVLLLCATNYLLNKRVCI